MEWRNFKKFCLMTEVDIFFSIQNHNDADVIANNLCLYFNCESDKLNLLIRVWLANLHNLK